MNSTDVKQVSGDLTMIYNMNTTMTSRMYYHIKDKGTKHRKKHSHQKVV